MLTRVALVCALSLLLPQASPQATVQQHLDAWIVASGVPGVAVGVVSKDGKVSGFAAGESDRTTHRKMVPTDLMLAGSTGKTFFAAVALQLIEQGKLGLDDPISKYLGTRPWFSRLPNAKDVTVRQLMTHSSGIIRYEFDDKFTKDLRANPDRTFTPEEEVAYLFDTKAPFEAGKGWDYSDTNYIVLGMIVEQITGTKYYDEIQKRFLTPLGLKGVAPSTSRRIAGLVPGYAGPRDPIGLPDEVMKDGVFAINPQFEWAGGGFATSAVDLARWGHELYVGRALSPAARKLMIDSAIPARLGAGAQYGLGVIIRPPQTQLGMTSVTWGHSGFFPGYSTELIHFVDSGLTLAIQINSSGPRTQGSASPLRVLYEIAKILQ